MNLPDPPLAQPAGPDPAETAGAAPEPAPFPPPEASPEQLELLERLAAHYGSPGPEPGLSILELGAYLILQQGGDRAGAREAVERIRSATVDWNEVRVSSLSELLEWCRPAGGQDLKARCLQLREYLANVYRDQNDVTLGILKEMDLEQRRKYLAGLAPLKPWMIHHLLCAADHYRVFQFNNDMNRVLQRTGLIEREGSPRKAAEAAERLIGGHERSVAYQGALVQHGLDICIPAIRVTLCRVCPIQDSCPSSKA